MRALPGRYLGHLGSGPQGAGDDAIAELQEPIHGLPLRHLPPVRVPPTVTASILIVGQPTPTGTDCPSLPQVQTPSDTPRSLPSMLTRVITSGPLPIRFTPFSGAVISPFSIR